MTERRRVCTFISWKKMWVWRFERFGHVMSTLNFTKGCVRTSHAWTFETVFIVAMVSMTFYCIVLISAQKENLVYNSYNDFAFAQMPKLWIKIRGRVCSFKKLRNLLAKSYKSLSGGSTTPETTEAIFLVWLVKTWYTNVVEVSPKPRCPAVFFPLQCSGKK